MSLIFQFGGLTTKGLTTHPPQKVFSNVAQDCMMSQPNNDKINSDKKLEIVTTEHQKSCQFRLYITKVV